MADYGRITGVVRIAAARAGAFAAFSFSGRAGFIHRSECGATPQQEDPPIIKGNAPVDRVRVNGQIRARQVRVIDDEGEQLGIMAPEEALREAANRELDLVEVAPKANPPVCKIMDYGKYRYQQSKRAKESKKHHHTVSLKEIKYRPKIDKHDFEYKTNHVREFLAEGSKVKVTIMFRGREMAHPEFGRDILTKVVEATTDLTAEKISTQDLRLEGRNMSMVLTPTKAALAASEARAAAGERAPSEIRAAAERAAKRAAAAAQDGGTPGPQGQ